MIKIPKIPDGFRSKERDEERMLKLLGKGGGKKKALKPAKKASRARPRKKGR
jgi:hypothetical protein